MAIITGGNSGIGAAAARRVAELGAQIVVTGRRQSEGRLFVNDIKRNNGSAAFIQADLSQPEQVKRIVPFTLETFGRLDYAFRMPEMRSGDQVLKISISQTIKTNLGEKLSERPSKSFVRHPDSLKMKLNIEHQCRAEAAKSRAIPGEALVLD